jgi:hypothetical protein
MENGPRKYREVVSVHHLAKRPIDQLGINFSEDAEKIQRQPVRRIMNSDRVSIIFKP